MLQASKEEFINKNVKNTRLLAAIVLSITSETMMFKPMRDHSSRLNYDNTSELKKMSSVAILYVNPR